MFALNNWNEKFTFTQVYIFHSVPAYLISKYI